MSAIDTKIDEFSEEICFQEQAVQLLAGMLDDPIHYYSGKEHHGFRYRNPGPAHFCLLKAVRCVSALRAIMLLLKGGFSQEIAVLIRTIVENTTHIEFVLVGYNAGQLEEPQRKYVGEYFSDFKRDETADFLKPRVRQSDFTRW